MRLTLPPAAPNAASGPANPPDQPVSAPVVESADPGLTRPPMPLDVTRRPRAPKPDPSLTPAPFAKLTPASPKRATAKVGGATAGRATPATPRANETLEAGDLPEGSTGNPFLSGELKEAAERERRRAVRTGLLKAAGGIALGLVVLHFLLTRVIWRFPEPDVLSRHVTQAMEAVLPLVSTSRQPLRAGEARAVLAERDDAHHLRYIAEITLRLSEPFYVPAHTNGTGPYRLHQESLQSARADELRLRLFPEGDGPPVPEMPLLIQVSHRVDEPVVVRIPFTAERTAWTWRLQPPRLDLRNVDRNLAGDGIGHYAGSPHLVFGNESLNEVEALTQAARAYIIRVQQAIQRVAAAGAVQEPAAPKADPAKKPDDPAEKQPADPAASAPKGP